MLVHGLVESSKLALVLDDPLVPLPQLRVEMIDVRLLLAAHVPKISSSPSAAANWSAYWDARSRLVERSKLALVLADPLVPLPQLRVEMIDVSLLLAAHVPKILELPLGLGDEHFTLVHLIRQPLDLDVVLLPVLADVRQLLLELLEPLVTPAKFLVQVLDLSVGVVVRVTQRCQFALEVVDACILLVDHSDKRHDPIVRGSTRVPELRELTR